MDTIGDFLTVLRNAARAKKVSCEVQFSRIRKEIADILKKEGYIADVFEKTDEKGFKRLGVYLKYVQTVPALTALRRCSTPGSRWYVGKESVPSVLNGLGICILSTSKGLMSGRSAKRLGVGGELICKVW